MVSIYVYGYLNRPQSGRRLERETQRNVELAWLTERSTPDFKTIADFSRDKGQAIRNVCREFIVLCRAGPTHVRDSTLRGGGTATGPIICNSIHAIQFGKAN